VVSDGLGPIPPLAETMPNQRTPAPPSACSQSLSDPELASITISDDWCSFSSSAEGSEGPPDPSLEGRGRISSQPRAPGPMCVATRRCTNASGNIVGRGGEDPCQ
jgi:hypothetical protein